jgi:hypothetical protein
MHTTILNYPGFQALPKGIKQMLVASEEHFFDQPASHHKEQKRNGDGSPPAWEYFKRRAYDSLLTGRLLACPNEYEGSAVFPWWIGFDTKYYCTPLRAFEGKRASLIPGSGC